MDKKNESGLEFTNKLLIDSIKICDKFFNQIEKKLKNLNDYRSNINEINSNNDNISDLKDIEQDFWNELKSFKETNDPIVIQYIIGVYIKIQQITLLYLNLSKKNDIYFIHGLKIKNYELDFLYNVYIHLGDLNRYLKNVTLAKQYYLKARTINPNEGQSYNQLALIYGSDPIKSIYYYVRAYLAIEPSKIALNNLKFTIKHFMNTNPIIKLLFHNSSLKIDKIKVENWLYLIVIAIFADNMSLIINYLFDEINYWFRFKNISLNCNSNDQKENDELDINCLFAGLDLFLDYCYFNNSVKFSILDYEKKLKEFKDLIIEYCNNAKLDLTKENKNALRHDYMLQGFSFLQKFHNNLIFNNIKSNQQLPSLNLLLIRINNKLNSVLDLINDKKFKSTKPVKKIRNIALQSILNANSN